jgi:uncharacterized membrane protein YphA (DoxX/SURF4 family)
MMVAVFKVHLSGGFFMPTGFEFAFTLGMIALALILTGPGRLASADIEGRLFRRGRQGT